MSKYFRENPISDESLAWVSRLKYGIDLATADDPVPDDPIPLASLINSLRGYAAPSYELCAVDFWSDLPFLDDAVARILLSVAEFQDVESMVARDDAKNIVRDLVSLKQKKPQLIVSVAGARMTTHAFRSKGYGSTLYLYALFLLFMQIPDLESVIFMSDWAAGGSTSPEALRVWKSLANQLRPQNEMLYLQGSEHEKAQVLFIRAKDLRTFFRLNFR